MRLQVAASVYALIFAWAAAVANADEIHTAVQKGDVPKIKQILKDNPQAINAKFQQGYTPLHWAIRTGRNKDAVVDALLAAKPKLNVQDDHGYTPLHWATIYRRKELIEALVQRGADINLKDKQGLTPLQHAMMYRFGGANDVTGVLLAAVKDVNFKLPGGESLLHYAARNGYDEAVAALLKRKAKPQSKNAQGYTPLQLAVQANQQKTAALLIPRTNVKTFRTIEGGTLLHWAAATGLADVADLVSRGADPNVTNPDGDTPLHLAAWYNRGAMVRALLSAKAKVDAADVSGRTPLHGAAWNGHADVVAALLAGGANANAAADGYTPLHGAAWQGHDKVVVLLVAGKTNPNAKDSDGATPLHKAAWRGHQNVVKALLAAGGNPRVKDREGYTPADMARSAGKKDVAALLSR